MFESPRRHHFLVLNKPEKRSAHVRLGRRLGGSSRGTATPRDDQRCLLFAGDAAGLRGYAWYIGGYALGIAVPPDWVDMHRIQPTAEVLERSLEAGMVFNFENQSDVCEDWPGESGAAYIETLIMTESGLEVLSKLPRGLVAV